MMKSESRVQLVGTAGLAGGGGAVGVVLAGGAVSSSDFCDPTVPRFSSARLNDNTMKTAAQKLGPSFVTALV